MVWLESLKGKDHSEELGVDGRIILQSVLEKKGGKVWNGFIWLRIGTSSGLL
jgi:hypothetical protein